MTTKKQNKGREIDEYTERRDEYKPILAKAEWDKYLVCKCGFRGTVAITVKACPKCGGACK